MHIANVTEIRQNASRVIARVVQSGQPAVVLQRSKPVVYVVEASAYEDMVRQLEEAKSFLRKAETERALASLADLREKMAKRPVQEDSVSLVRDLREGRIR
ncbi:MAG: type II toxin-antitoxin system Phd/YefM family antitoxin [Peptococcaceae bacterium]|jgi:prevent-host-death family protein|nr:type II toxin-antitoxin system Phd/YefM family antitoxin [Peptococcaceae bacterium]